MRLSKSAQETCYFDGLYANAVSNNFRYISSDICSRPIRTANQTTPSLLKCRVAMRGTFFMLRQGMDVGACDAFERRPGSAQSGGFGGYAALNNQT
jgi:hypothetical protein